MGLPSYKLGLLYLQKVAIDGRDLRTSTHVHSVIKQANEESSFNWKLDYDERERVCSIKNVLVYFVTGCFLEAGVCVGV